MKILNVFAWLFPSYLQMNVAAIGAAAAVGGAAISSSASKSAAKSQAKGADAANQTSQMQYNQTRSDNMPFLQSGYGANNLLSAYLGLDTGPTYTADQIRQMAINEGFGGGQRKGGSDVYHEGELNDEIARRLAAQQAQQDAISTAKDNGSYGSLLKKFDQNDLNNDVVYQSGLQFGLDEGSKAINRQSAASGNMLSGAAAKALTRFGNDYGSTKANESYNRYNTDNTGIYNKLAGISGAGQNAVNQVSASGANMANNVASNQIGLGNARGASAISSANSFNNALSSGVNAYQQQNYLNSLNNYPQAGTGTYAEEMARLTGQ